MSLPTALLGFLICRLIPSVYPLTPQEHALLQATAIATGSMPLTGGFIGIIPGLALVDKERDGQDPVVLTWAASVAFSFAMAYFGYVRLSFPFGAISI